MLSHALVLTAGIGTRLRPLTDIRAKPAIPVAGEAIARRIVRWLASAGVTDVVLNLHHLPHTITAELGDGSDLSVRVRYSWEQPAILGSAGGPRLALPLLEAEKFFVVNGDTLTDIDLGALTTAHAASGALVTLALVPNPDPARYGGVTLDEDRCVTGFVPRGAPARGSFHFTGPQIVHAEVFHALPLGQPARSIGGIYDGLIAARPGSVRGFVTNARFLDVGTVSDYWSTSWSLIREAGGDGTRGRRVRVDSRARVSRSICWDDVEIQEDCVVDECVITDDVCVPRGTTIRRAILSRAPDGSVRRSPLSI